MKKLISEKTIEKAFATGKMQIKTDPTDIITAQAHSVAEKLGVEILRDVSQKVSYTDRQKIIDAVMERFPSGKFSRTKIEKAVREVLDAS